MTTKSKSSPLFICCFVFAPADQLLSIFLEKHTLNLSPFEIVIVSCKFCNCKFWFCYAFTDVKTRSLFKVFHHQSHPKNILRVNKFFYVLSLNYFLEATYKCD